MENVHIMNQIETQLNQLRLNGMVNSWKAMQETRRHNELSLQEGLEILLQSEHSKREKTDALSGFEKMLASAIRSPSKKSDMILRVVLIKTY